MSEPGQPKRRIGCLPVFGIFLIVVATAIGGILLWFRVGTDHIKDEYKARQLPTSLQELDAWYAAVPDAENAALGFLAATDEIVATSTEAEWSLPIVGKHDPNNSRLLEPDGLLAAKEYLAKNTKALELAHAAAKLKSARYPMDLTLGLQSIDTKPLERIRHVARLLWLQGLVRAQDKNTAGAVESYIAAYAVGRSVSDQPLLIAQLVAVAIEGQTTRDICVALSATPFPASDLDKLIAIVSQSPGIRGYGNAIAGEGVFALFNPSPLNPLNGPIGRLGRSSYARDIIYVFDASALDLNEAIVQIDALGNRQPGAIGQRLFFMSSAVIPSFTRAFDSVARAEISRDLLLLVLAVEKYRLETNALPDNLAQLAPKFLESVPDDPYGLGPYLYTREDPGYAVYSVGADRTDGNGGKLREGRPPAPMSGSAQSQRIANQPRPGDITLRITR